MRRRGRRSTWTATRLHHRGAASVDSATRLRQELGSWLRAMGVSAELAYDLVLGCYEAMTNVVAHAYPAGTTGMLDLTARLRDDHVTVTVSDRGRWKPQADTGSGRGLALIRRVSDRMDLLRGDYGTRVRMQWRRA